MAGRTGLQPRRYLRLVVLALVCLALVAHAVQFNTSATALSARAAEHGSLSWGTSQGNGIVPQAEEPVIDQDGLPNFVENRTLTKRIPPLPFIDTPYKQAKKRGEKLLCALKKPSQAGAAVTSQWNRIEQLGEWGWVREVDERDDEKDYSHVVKAATGGTYTNIYYPHHGIILANDNYSPAHQASQNKGEKIPFKDSHGKPLPLPALKQWSTVNALTYASLPSPQPLRYVLRRNIRNPATVEIVSTVLKKGKWDDEGRAPVWPGRVVREGERGFEALVGSPNVGGVVWLLMEGGQAVGAREVRSVRVWRDVGGVYAPTMMVEVG
ncbi:hypothetical protein PRZ48_002251 [Zasmidium cellare]|uniref:Uncharacterized protein n=1 Tax=Zasmidium cellare TaxID=395010 RepID=A0ABR0F3H9_ZASCE|nr:hypothetical protein PRZ48_002251 [Zasmidium cellare]